jgi:poly-D-alanine transfer protein DltD
MKKVVFFHFIPLLLAIVLLFSLSSKINSHLFHREETLTEECGFRHIANFRDYKQFEDQFLKSGNDSETIFILGSSELTSGGEALPFNFISNHFSTQVKGVGHAGNQCFSIYSQLLANHNRLENAPVVIILSPNWFFGNDAKGTTSSLFLEYNSEKFIENILIIDEPRLIPFKVYEAKRIGNFYTEILNPDINLRQLYFENLALKSGLHKWIYFPVIQTNKLSNMLKHKLICSDPNENEIDVPIHRKPIIPESVSIHWDSLLMAGKHEHLNNSTNNSWYISNDYYAHYIKGKTRAIHIVNKRSNQEWEDFKMLLRLLHCNNVNASFLLLPLNPYYYSNLEFFTPFVNNIEAELKKYQFPFLNFWNTDTATFDKGVLTDIMHLSKYGWYQVNKFIVETYHLAQ